MNLRPYQRDAVDAVYAFLRSRDDNPCVVIPTGGGKTPVIATICRDAVERWNGRVVVLTHVKELVEQTVLSIRATAPGVPVGVYSASLNRRDTGYAVTVSTIQSVWRKADAIGPADLVLVDEAHMIPLDGAGGSGGGGDDGAEGMYRSFLSAMRELNPMMRVVGFTATPFRLRGGMICSPTSPLNAVCYEVGVRDLTAAGFLAPMRVESGPKNSARINYGELRLRAGEFASGDLERVVGEEPRVVAWIDDLVERTRERRSVLVFASGVEHGERVVQTFRERHGIECGFVSAKTPDAERDDTLRRFAEGELRYLCNVAVLTTGYDAPRIDCIALMRPTNSPGLYAQMIGRGVRLSPETGKADCLVLDYGGNALRHGLPDAIRLPDDDHAGPTEGDEPEALPPARECPACASVVPTESANCPACGKPMPPLPKPKRAARPTGPVWAAVDRVEYHEHTRRDGTGFPTMRVEYHLAGGGSPSVVREWICLQHPRGSFARRKAEHWWACRSRNAVPVSVEDAVAIANAGALAEPRSVLFERPKGERYDRLIEYELPPRPPAVDAAAAIRAARSVWFIDGARPGETDDTFDGIPV